jgi:hypothetical protein
MIHVSRPRATSRSAKRRECPDCKAESLFASVFYEWYGWTTTCLLCGRNWQDGEWMPLPFRRSARADSIRSAHAAFRRAGGVKPLDIAAP